MKYLIGFLRFWRNFIIGDDPTIAITIMWSFVAVFSLIKINVQAWYLVPIVVAVLFVILFGRSLRSYVATHKKYIQPHVSMFYPIDALWIPMVATVAIPFCLFRMASLEFSLERFFLPITIICIIISAAVLILLPHFHKYPAFCSFLAAGICLLLLKPAEAPMLRFFGMIAEHAYIANIALLAILLLALALLIQHVIKRRELTA